MATTLREADIDSGRYASLMSCLVSSFWGRVGKSLVMQPGQNTTQTSYLTVEQIAHNAFSFPKSSQTSPYLLVPRRKTHRISTIVHHFIQDIRTRLLLALLSP
jgi:hypothetical protein